MGEIENSLGINYRLLSYYPFPIFIKTLVSSFSKLRVEGPLLNHRVLEI